MGGRGKEFVCWRGLRIVAANLLPLHGVLDSLRRNLGNKLKGVERNVLPRTVNAHLTVGEVYGKNSAGYQCCGAPPKKMKKITTKCKRAVQIPYVLGREAAHCPIEPRTRPSRTPLMQTPLMQAPLRWQRVSFRSQANNLAKTRTGKLLARRM